jgi:hypothetical protein
MMGRHAFGPEVNTSANIVFRTSWTMLPIKPIKEFIAEHKALNPSERGIAP